MPKRKDSLSIPILVDGCSLVYRSSYASALQDLKVTARPSYIHHGNNESFVVPAVKEVSEKVWLTGGIYSSIRSLLSVLKTIRTSDRIGPVLVFYDGGRHPMRTKLFPEYKQNRDIKERKDEKVSKQIHEQVDASKLFFRSLGCRVVTMKKREADDCIAQLVNMIGGIPNRPSYQSCPACRSGSGTGKCTCDDVSLPYVVSGDRDMWGLFNRARIYDLNLNEVVRESHFKKRFGIGSKHFVHYKALCGDASDNLPGIKGVGDKTVAAFVNALGSRISPDMAPPEAMEKWLMELTESDVAPIGIRAKLILNNCQHAVKVCRAVSLHDPGFKGKRLARLVRRVNRVREFDRLSFEALCREYKFKSLLADVDVEPMFSSINSREFSL